MDYLFKNKIYCNYKRTLTVPLVLDIANKHQVDVHQTPSIQRTDITVTRVLLVKKPK